MLYRGGEEARAGDTVLIGGAHKSLVVASIDNGTYLPGYEGWEYLEKGVLIDTPFGGLVHYPEPLGEVIELMQRATE